MKTTDLRIGNLVYNQHGEIDEIDYDFFRLPIADSNDYRPIPLSEEWLVRLGYLPSTNMNFEGGFSNGSPLYVQMMAGGVFTVFYEGDTSWQLLRKVDYVHELQNVYFYLRYGEELTASNLQT